MLDWDVKKLNELLEDKDEHIIVAIRRLYIQEFAEANYGRELTEAELEELTWMVWKESWKLDEWLDEAIRQIVPEEEIATYKEHMSKEFQKNTRTTIPKKAIIYCRTACKEQKNKNLALSGQEEVCLSSIKKSDHLEVIGVIVDDGVGSDEQKDRLVKLFGMLKKKGAEVLIVCDTTRISRGYNEYKSFKKSLEIAGIELVVVTPDLYEIGDRAMKDYKKYREKVRRLKKSRFK